MATAKDHSTSIFATEEEGRALFDRAARELVGMSGEEFLRQWDAGEWDDRIDHPEWHGRLMRVVMLIPFARRHSG